MMQLRRSLLAAAVLALLWALALKVTDGIAIETGWRLISSRNAVRPLIAGLALVAWYVAVWRRHWRGDLGRYSTPAPWPRLLARLATLVALIVGFGWGTRIAAGPDPSGYVSQAAMFARGELTVPAPAWSRNAPWDDAALTAAPVGWVPTRQTHLLSPMYSPGLPLMMAALQRVAGPGAVFYVVPVLGAVLVWSTCILGSRLAGPWAGTIAATLIVSSPTFLLMQQQAMSDVPVSALLTLSMVLVLGAQPAFARASRQSGDEIDRTMGAADTSRRSGEDGPAVGPYPDLPNATRQSAHETHPATRRGRARNHAPGDRATRHLGRGGRVGITTAALSGLAAAAAVLVRPNLAPLVVLPLLLVLIDARSPVEASDRRDPRVAGARSRGAGALVPRQRTLWRLAAFLLPVGVAAALIATLNWRYHGSPLLSGYGPLSAYYSLDGLGTNLRQYGRWFLQGHTPIVLLGVGAVLAGGGNRVQRVAIALVTLALPLSLLVIYMPYMVFNENDWGSTRFLLPGYPGVFAGFGAILTLAVARATRRMAAATAAVALVGLVAAWGWNHAVQSGVFRQRIGDARYARAVDYVRQLPRRSVILSNAHSGTLRFYTSHDVLRFEAIRPWELDTAVAHLRQLGYVLFFVGDEFEIEQFRTRFADSRTAAALGRKPRDAFDGVVVYDVR